MGAVRVDPIQILATLVVRSASTGCRQIVIRYPDVGSRRVLIAWEVAVFDGHCKESPSIADEKGNGICVFD